MIYWLLKLPEEIQNALREGAIGVLPGYIFEANLNHFSLMEIFQETAGEGFTSDGLTDPVRQSGTDLRRQIQGDVYPPAI